MLNYDIAIKNAKIVDGSNSPWFRGDLGIKNGKIVFIGTLQKNISSMELIDADGLILSPGFIDIHTHNDLLLLGGPILLNNIEQGITTIMIGQCGISPAPIEPNKLSLLKEYTNLIQVGVNTTWNWHSFDDFLNLLDKLELGINVGAFVGHGTIRLNIMGFGSRKPTRREISKMKKLCKMALKQGAFGVSAGLIYPPGVYSEIEELIEIAKCLKDYNGVFHFHVRNESKNILGAIKEAINIARIANIPCQISHLKVMGEENKNLMVNVLELLERSREEGVDVTADTYPYVAGSSTLRSILPPWLYKNGVDEAVNKLKNLDIRNKIIDEINNTNDWENFFKNCGGGAGVMVIDSPETPEYEGKNLFEIGKMMNKETLEASFDVIIKNKGKAKACFFMMNEENVKEVIKHPLVMIASDSIPPTPGAKCHPRVNGTFPRVLGKYVREEKILPLEEAIWKMTGFPATRLNIWNKGFIKVGMDADLVIFDPEKIKDKSTFKNPFEEPNGIRYLLINGKIVLKNGEYTGKKVGKVLRNNL